MATNFDAENAPSDVTEIDLSAADEETAVEGRFVEVVDGPADPGGSLLVKLTGSNGDWRLLTKLAIGWEHPMQIIGVKKTGSTVTVVRIWR